ncbi:hypothetical protein N7537_008014 [Penicillium hordei]|uniref:Uncharacterized protein n=1 Tax=Penicillium hordei TaxID=40994 RepID=A0AAD6DZM5_9EURO|nr:uncharacterized protein N7537_008014 [Penicillium hordei]KAJ5597930.1 hypothetical protein N7537_008014 [Penicillium hordei]
MYWGRRTWKIWMKGCDMHGQPNWTWPRALLRRTAASLHNIGLVRVPQTSNRILRVYRPGFETPQVSPKKDQAAARKDSRITGSA